MLQVAVPSLLCVTVTVFLVNSVGGSKTNYSKSISYGGSTTTTTESTTESTTTDKIDKIEKIFHTPLFPKKLLFQENREYR